MKLNRLPLPDVPVRTQSKTKIAWRNDRHFRYSIPPQANSGTSDRTTGHTYGAPAGSRFVIQLYPASIEHRGGLWFKAITQQRVIFLLRLSLAAIFFWFGLLKIANVSPVVALLKSTLPFLAASPYIELLGLVEIGIAAGLVTERLSKQATILMILHLFGTLSVVLINPQLFFAPEFPVLTMDGEFVMKNLVLITAGLVIVCSRGK